MQAIKISSLRGCPPFHPLSLILKFAFLPLTGLVLFILLLTACAVSSPHNLDQVDTMNLAQLERVRVYPRLPREHTMGVNPMRAQALRESALGTGAQGSLAKMSMDINQRLDHYQKYLESIFDFSAMMLAHGVLPPILVEGNNSLHLSDQQTIRLADKTYKIIAQARFATTPPNWREYLWLHYDKPTLPDASLLPRTDEEQLIWRHSVQVGWEKGIEQAYDIFQQNLARLERDYRGMMLYRKLLKEKMINSPFVARTTLGITGNGENLRINDQVLRIVALPVLQTNGKKWQAIIVKHHH